MTDGEVKDLRRPEEMEAEQEIAMLAEAMATETEFYTVVEVEAALAALETEGETTDGRRKVVRRPPVSVGVGSCLFVASVGETPGRQAFPRTSRSDHRRVA